MLLRNYWEPITEFDAWHGFHMISFFVCSIIFDCLYTNPIVSGWCDAEASELILISGSVTVLFHWFIAENLQCYKFDHGGSCWKDYFLIISQIWWYIHKKYQFTLYVFVPFFSCMFLCWYICTNNYIIMSFHTKTFYTAFPWLTRYFCNLYDLRLLLQSRWEHSSH